MKKMKTQRRNDVPLRPSKTFLWSCVPARAEALLLYEAGTTQRKEWRPGTCFLLSKWRFSFRRHMSLLLFLYCADIWKEIIHFRKRKRFLWLRERLLFSFIWALICASARALLDEGKETSLSKESQHVVGYSLMCALFLRLASWKLGLRTASRLQEKIMRTSVSLWQHVDEPPERARRRERPSLCSISKRCRS